MMNTDRMTDVEIDRLADSELGAYGAVERLIANLRDERAEAERLRKALRKAQEARSDR